VDTLVKALQTGMADKDFRSRMSTLGATVMDKEANPAALQAKVEQQVPQWGRLVQESGRRAPITSVSPTAFEKDA
jgi:tripartite-type tricarboxylate transporter receptor subunit TctC